MPKKSKIKVLHRDYTERQEQLARQYQQTDEARKRHQVRLLSLGLVVTIITVVCLFQIVQSRVTVVNLQKQTTDVNKELKTVQAKNDQLNQQVKQLKDKDYVQKLIREKYYYTKKGETVYTIPKTN
ncbi:MAG TPA: septum formation initiator family protein [Ligilactobacillus saerimneri]|uniref:FtsB family cell division protein n=1 Tax=Ligilactobacillus saerimneri TaxID=228229 RepID=UPI001D99A55A|nr:septum formation initiator family protein [Ligilactobacillus saerimneri]MDY4003621.1 septum formation initiator family protein [Ligilactobacillus saerimneri]HJF29639.1 septum formation initiator family protein [Ligilactobacillus saerimneri]